MWGPKGWFWYLLTMIPKVISFHAVVVLVLFFPVSLVLPLTMLWVNLVYFASMYFRSGTFKTSYLPKGYVMYLRLKMQVHVRNSSKNYKKSFLLFRHSNEFRLFGWILRAGAAQNGCFWNFLYEKYLIQISILGTKK